jgi:hypothetical protein
MNDKNKKIFDKIKDETIIRLRELEDKKRFGIITLNLRVFSGQITNDIDFSFKETLKLDK